MTAHGIPVGPLQFDRLEAAPAAKCISQDQGNIGKALFRLFWNAALFRDQFDRCASSRCPLEAICASRRPDNRKFQVADDKTKVGPNHEDRINIHEKYEVEDKGAGVSEEELKELVARHGAIAVNVRSAMHVETGRKAIVPYSVVRSISLNRSVGWSGLDSRVKLCP